MLKITKIAMTVMLAVCLMPLAPVFAEQSYRSTYIDHHAGDEAYIIQDVYTTSTTIVGSGQTAFSQPSDLFITDRDHVFVADTGNDRIVELDGKGAFLREIGNTDGPGKLKSPEGIFVAKNGTIYAADTGNQRVAVFNPEGDFMRAYRKPDSSYLPADYYMVPVKLIVDARGVMYVTSKGSYQGLLRMNQRGEFTGFFAANKASAGIMDRFKKLFFTREQREQEKAIRPQEISNVTLDKDGFIFTATLGIRQGQIKKLNAGGINRFDQLRSAKFSGSTQIVDVAVDGNLFFYVLDRGEQDSGSSRGMVSIYSPGATELFRFGKVSSLPEQRGVLSYPASIAVDSQKQLWVLDNALNLIQVYKRTEFGETVLTAAVNYYKGDYERSKADWEKVISLNEIIGISYMGLGKAAQHEGKVDDAMQYYMTAYDAEGYSDTFWTYRTHWLEDHVVAVVAGIVIAIVLYRILGRRAGPYVRKAPPRLLGFIHDLKECAYVMFHPYEGFYKLKGKKVPFLSLITILMFVFLANLLSIYFRGFIFHPVDLSKINLLYELAFFYVPWCTWVIANYLVSSIKHGEGHFREIFQASIYALFPYIVFTIPIVVLSNILVLDEAILIQSLSTVMWLWICVLFIVKTQVTHNFEFVENLKNVLITLFTIGIIWIFSMVSMGLTFNLYDFIYQLFKEVTLLG